MASNVKHFIFLVVSTMLFCACSAQTVRWCTISDKEQTKCTDMATNFDDRFSSDVECVQETSHLKCMSAISDGDADVVTLDGGDIYIAGRDYSMKPVIAEDYGNGQVTYWVVAVARKSDDITFDNLEGKKSCHTGIGKTSGWNIPIGVLIEKEYIKLNLDECHVPKAVGEFFVQSCVPGALDPLYDPNKDNPENLCDLCIGEGDNNCVRSHDEPYYDYSGSFRCLAENAGEVAFMKHSTVKSYTDGKTPGEWGKKYNSTDYKLLCADGTTESDVDNYRSCNLASVPSHAVMTSGDKSKAYVESVVELLNKAQAVFGPDNNPTDFKMFDSSDYAGSDLLFKDSTLTLLPVGDKDTYDKFLGDEYLDAIKAINCEKGGASLLKGSFMLILSLLLLVLGMK